MLFKGSPLSELVLLKYPQHILLAWWVKAVPPSRCCTLWCKVLQPLAGWFLSLFNLRIERKLEKAFFSHAKSRSVPSFTSVFAGYWNIAVSLPKLDTTSHLLFWDVSGQGSHHGLVTSPATGGPAGIWITPCPGIEVSFFRNILTEFPKIILE